MVSTMLGDPAAKQLLQIPLSDNTISRRIDDMSQDLNDQLIERFKSKHFGIQLDEATDTCSDAHLICYVRFMDGENMIEDLMFCKSITGGCTSASLFQILDSFIEENGIDWEKCVGVCTDGARAMSGCYEGLQALIRRKAPEAMWTHCVIHREALASKYLCPLLNEVLEVIVKVVNFTKTRPVKARYFGKLCLEMGAEHTALLYYCNSRWLSKGNVLRRVCELRHELHAFLVEEKHTHADNFADIQFLLKMEYICDIFEKLNSLNMSLQGNDTHILQLFDKIHAFMKKLDLWRKKLEESYGNTDSFPWLQQFVIDNDVQISPVLISLFTDHLSVLKLHFQKYFPDDMEQYRWIRNPFLSDSPLNFTTGEHEQLIDLSSDSTLKSRFPLMSLPVFLSSVSQEYPSISSRALRVLIPFATSYLCEAGFQQ